jgi:hypothetical protein
VPAFRLLRVGVKLLIQGRTIQRHRDVTVIFGGDHLSWSLVFGLSATAYGVWREASVSPLSEKLVSPKGLPPAPPAGGRSALAPGDKHFTPRERLRGAVFLFSLEGVLAHTRAYGSRISVIVIVIIKG